MKKFLFLLALSAVARKVIAAVKGNKSGAGSTPNETPHPSTH